LGGCATGTCRRNRLLARAWNSYSLEDCPVCG